MRPILTALLLAAGAAAPITVTVADIQIPTIVTVYFQKEGKPYHKPVDFKVRCYGWASYPGDPGFPPGKKPEPYEPKEVYSFSGACPDYGCKVHHNFYLNYKHIEYCNLEGQSEGTSIRVEKFGDSPISNCREPQPETGYERQCELRITLPG